MRLAQVRTGHRLPQKLKLGLIRILSGQKINDMIRVLLYRPELYGKAHGQFADGLMRPPAEWSTGERELFGTFVSSLNQCPF